MICKRIEPAPELADFVREYMLLHLQFDPAAAIPCKSYPVNPEEGLIFLIRGNLSAESPELGTWHKRPQVFLFGLPACRQNLLVTHDFLMLCVRFRPGALFRLLGIPMTELVHQYEDAELVLGREIASVREQLVNAADYTAMLAIVNIYLENKITKLKNRALPIDRIGEIILAAPQSFNLDKTAEQACLSHRQFEKRFMQQIGVTPKFFSRICRFYQAYLLKECQPHRNWFSIAIETGYNDYQHLVKDFKQFTGTAPPVFIRECEQNPERLLNIAENFRGA